MSDTVTIDDPRPLPIPPGVVCWIEALLSGEYKQGTECLCTRKPTGDEYCCLGVAASLIGLFIGERTVEKWQEDLGDYVDITEAYVSYPNNTGVEISSQILPEPIWRNLIGEDILLDQCELADSNDKGLTFRDIVIRHILPAYNHTLETFEEMYGPVSSQS